MPYLRDKQKFVHFHHNPFTMVIDGINVSCDEKGKMLISTKDEEGNDLEIETTAAFFIKVAKMLHTTRRVEYSKDPQKSEAQD